MEERGTKSCFHCRRPFRARAHGAPIHMHRPMPRTPSLSQRHQSRIYFVLSLRCPSRALRCTTRLDRSILCWASEKHGSSWQVVGHGGGGGGGGLTGRPLTGASPTCSWWPRTRFTRAVLASVCSGRRQRSREGRLCELCFPASA
jgi:hypothetical protein